jgi:hypothetical protein
MTSTLASDPATFSIRRFTCCIALDAPTSSGRARAFSRAACAVRRSVWRDAARSSIWRRSVVSSRSFFQGFST